MPKDWKEPKYPENATGLREHHALANLAQAVEGYTGNCVTRVLEIGPSRVISIHEFVWEFHKRWRQKRPSDPHPPCVFHVLEVDRGAGLWVAYSSAKIYVALYGSEGLLPTFNLEQVRARIAEDVAQRRQRIADKRARIQAEAETQRVSLDMFANLTGEADDD
jgi:hypothetical protein